MTSSCAHCRRAVPVIEGDGPPVCRECIADGVEVATVHERTRESVLRRSDRPRWHRGARMSAVRGRDDVREYELGTLPDEVVNQRVMVVVYATAEGERAGTLNATVWIDRDRSGATPFEMGPEAWRGWNGGGLSADERAYVGACLYSAAVLVAGAWEQDADAPD